MADYPRSLLIHVQSLDAMFCSRSLAYALDKEDPNAKQLGPCVRRTVAETYGKKTADRTPLTMCTLIRPRIAK
jgi:hypothetical protein